MFPSKVTPIKDSIFPDLLVIMKAIRIEQSKPYALYQVVKRRAEMSLDVFLICLDILYAIGYIELKEGVLIYVEKDVF